MQIDRYLYPSLSSTIYLHEGNFYRFSNWRFRLIRVQHKFIPGTFIKWGANVRYSNNEYFKRVGRNQEPAISDHDEGGHDPSIATGNRNVAEIAIAIPRFSCYSLMLSALVCRSSPLKIVTGSFVTTFYHGISPCKTFLRLRVPAFYLETCTILSSAFGIWVVATTDLAACVFCPAVLHDGRVPR